MISGRLFASFDHPPARVANQLFGRPRRLRPSTPRACKAGEREREDFDFHYESDFIYSSIMLSSFKLIISYIIKKILHISKKKLIFIYISTAYHAKEMRNCGMIPLPFENFTYQIELVGEILCMLSIDSLFSYL